MTLKNRAQFATATPAEGTRPTRAIRAKLKDMAFEAGSNELKRILMEEKGITVEQGHFAMNVTDTASALRTLFNSVYGPTMKVEQADAEEEVKDWFAQAGEAIPDTSEEESEENSEEEAA